MSKTITVVGPDDHGRPMTLDEFEFAEGREGYLYELSRGVITVIDVPKRPHAMMVDAIRQQLSEYRAKSRTRLHAIFSGAECKIPVEGLVSERHPDLAVYKTAPPEDVSDDEVWAVWIPELVIEVVSPSSSQRDYEEKPAEYLQFGVREYWIVDADKGQMLVLKRSRGTWSERSIKPPQIYKTGLLPRLEFNLKAVLDAAGSAV